jgi:toxin ParE1/3/4
MADYRLSERASAQIFDIYQFTEECFGAYQAKAYHSGLEHSFLLVADFPLIGMSVANLFPDLRRFRFQSHFIYYTVETDMILIRQLLHVSVQADDNGVF